MKSSVSDQQCLCRPIHPPNNHLFIYRLQIRGLLLYLHFFVLSLSPFTQLLWSRLFVFALGLPLAAQQRSQLLQEDMEAAPPPLTLADR